MRICVVTNGPLTYSETFIRQHVNRLPAKTTLVDEWPPWARSSARWERTLPGRAYYRALSLLAKGAYRRRITTAYINIFRHRRVEVVLAEYGPTGVAVMDACKRLRLPLFVHFHGFDASQRRMLERYAPRYKEMFSQAAGIIAVSHAMRCRLIELGAPASLVHYNPCGVDCDSFGGADPAASAPLIIAVGRFVEKKAPQLTLAAFARVLQEYPEARLRMIGDGPLLGLCRKLSARLSLAHAVTFMGSLAHREVAGEMRRARLFAQHSVEAASGDCEGTPVSILEAGATGLPVVSTRHGGIPDVVEDGETGLLVGERDVEGMARAMLRLLRDPLLAAALGTAARRRVETHFSVTISIERLWAIISAASPPAPRILT
ncbi:MAG: colanic acid/amylovoran biosynthesis glycosyltransferase [Acidobacteriota bacterium]|jgi:glycosyltransferase involved in cell wall biosynthesis|nr:colanic acid/amylovoran biosynthesis glycosyltransferase [Acidobacteriota bacterium]